MRNLRDPYFSRTPSVAIREEARACGLACRHCSAEAINLEPPLFVGVRDYRRLKDKCGASGREYIRGGSRAGAHASTVDYMESGPGCAFVPGGYGMISRKGACASHVDA